MKVHIVVRYVDMDGYRIESVHLDPNFAHKEARKLQEDLSDRDKNLIDVLDFEVD